MLAYRIVEWKKRYEVTLKGRAASESTPLAELRKKPLDYVRSKVYGWNRGPALEAIIERAYIPGTIFDAAVFGVFHKCLEVAAAQERQYRGWLLDIHQQPVGAAQIARLFRSHEVELYQKALDMLCRPDVRWIEFAEFPEAPGSSRILPETPGYLYKETEDEGKTIQEKGPSSPPDFSVSASLSPLTGNPHAIRQKTLLLLADIFKSRKPADITTLQDIVEQLHKHATAGDIGPDVFEAVLQEARQCQRAQKPIAAFVARMKSPPYYYKPIGKVARTLGSALDLIKQPLLKG
jgi:hypothetical protein